MFKCEVFSITKDTCMNNKDIPFACEVFRIIPNNNNVKTTLN